MRKPTNCKVLGVAEFVERAGATKVSTRLHRVPKMSCSCFVEKMKSKVAENPSSAQDPTLTTARQG